MKIENPLRVPCIYCAAILVAALNVLTVRSAETKLDPKFLDACVGRYELGEARFTFRRQGNGLTVEVAKEGVFNLEARPDKRFVIRELPELGFTFRQDAKGKVTQVVFHKGGEDCEVPKTSDQAPQSHAPEVSKIPPRESKAGPSLIDLTGRYNARLDEFWQPDGASEVLQENHLGMMPRGIQRMGTMYFDIRGAIQLSGGKNVTGRGELPKEVKDIRIAQKCRRLHFLHGTQWRVADNTRIGCYVLHYTNGARAELPITYGQQVRDWWFSGSEDYEAKNARIAWKGSNPVTERQRTSLRIFESAHDNPRPEQQIQTIDFVSACTDSAPFLIAITLE